MGVHHGDGDAQIGQLERCAAQPFKQAAVESGGADEKQKRRYFMRVRAADAVSERTGAKTCEQHGLAFAEMFRKYPAQAAVEPDSPDQEQKPGDSLMPSPGGPVG